MYKLYTLEHVVEIPPEKFGHPKVQSAYEILSKEYQGIVDNDFGFIISIIEIIDVGPGKIIHNSAGTFHPVKFSLLAYKSEEAEIVEGEVVDALDMGIFIKLGYLDAMCHFSQLMDDSKPEFEMVNQRFTSKKLGLSIQKNDIVRGKIIKSNRKDRIGITLRGTPYLGKIEWIQDDLKNNPGKIVTPKADQGEKIPETPVKESAADEESKISTEITENVEEPEQPVEKKSKKSSKKK